MLVLYVLNKNLFEILKKIPIFTVFILNMIILRKLKKLCSRGGQNTVMFQFELAPKLILFSWLSYFLKHEYYLPRTSGSVSSRHH